MSLLQTTRNNDLCFLINKINNIDVRHASNCEIIDMFLQISDNDEDNKQKDKQPSIIVLEVQRKQQHQDQTCLILKHEQQQQLKEDFTHKSVQTVVSLQQQKSNVYYNDDRSEDDEDEEDLRAPTTINDIINEEDHQFIEQCLAPEIDIQEIILERRHDEQFGLTLCCNTEGGSTIVTNAGSGASDGELCCADVFIKDIEINGVAARCQGLRVGDQLLQIDGQNIKSLDHAQRFFNEQTLLTLLVSRYLYADDEEEEEEEEFENQEQQENQSAENIFIVDDNDNDELNYEKFLHEQAYINLVNSLDNALHLNKQQQDIREQEQNQEISMHKSSVINKSNKLQSQIQQHKILQDVNILQKQQTEQSDIESEHIYETIPEDGSESEPLYCSPYESTTTTLPTPKSRRNLPQQQFQKKKQQRVAQWLGMTSSTLKQQQQQIRTFMPFPQTLLLQQHSEQENSSSAYNTGGSNASIQTTTIITTTTTTTTTIPTHITTSTIETMPATKLISSPKHQTVTTPITWKQNGDLLNDEQQQQQGSFYTKTLGHNFIESKPMDFLVKHLYQQTQKQQTISFQAPNLSKYHFVSSQDTMPITKSVNSIQPQQVRGSTNMKKSQQNEQQHQQFLNNYNRPLEQHTYSHKQHHLPIEQQQHTSMVWKVKRRSDGTRYIVRRPVVTAMMLQNPLIGERTQISDMVTTTKAATAVTTLQPPTTPTTTEDDTISEVKIGRYWPKEERRRHIEKARERQQRQHQQQQHHSQFNQQIMLARKKQAQQLTITSPTKLNTPQIETPTSITSTFITTTTKSTPTTTINNVLQQQQQINCG